MDNRPIGVFDSGVGGLTTVREFRRILPGEDIIYFGDTGRVPYGTRSRQTIRKYASQVIRYLLGFDVKALVAACGTVGTNFPEEEVIAEIGVTIPYSGVVLPATRAACAVTKGRLGIIATPASIQSGAYERAVSAINPSIQVMGKACPLFVPLAENGMTGPDNEITRLTARMYLAPLLERRVDTLILGCTHYPLLLDTIRGIMGEEVALIDAGGEAARRVRDLLDREGLLARRERAGNVLYRVTDTVEGFVAVARHFLAEDIRAQTEFVDIEQISAPYAGRAGTLPNITGEKNEKRCAD